MHGLRLVSAVGQVAAHLRSELERGHWSGKMPGADGLAAELGVNRKTVEAALRQLEKGGHLVGQGPGRHRLIVAPGGKTARPLRVATLLYEPADRVVAFIVELQHALREAGHTVVSPAKSLTELGMDAARVGRLVRQTAADAWVVLAGSHEVLEWFCAQPVPTFAFSGRQTGLPIAGARPDKAPAISAATRHLIGLGHRGIVFLTRRDRRLPEPGGRERAFLDELKAHGLTQSPAGQFNLPDWEETREGLQHLLTELYRVTPPTAFIIDEAPFFVATQQLLARRRILAPERVSLICTDPDPIFAWCTPSIAHIRWDAGPIVRRIVRWAATVSRGGRDVRQALTAAEFVPGGTIGPAPQGVSAARI